MKNKKPLEFKTGTDLTNDLHFIGTNFAAYESRVDPDIEMTLVSASVAAINSDDSRIAGVLVDWISIHQSRIDVDRLTQFINSLDEKEYKFVRIFWCANAQRFLNSDFRFKRLAEIYKGPRVDLADRNASPGSRGVTEMFIKMRDEDERFLSTCIRIPKKYFSHRPEQIHEPKWIAKTHMGFRYRVMFGPSYRADIWAYLRRNPDLTAYRLSKFVGCSTTTALRVKHDYEIVKRDYSNRGGAA